MVVCASPEWQKVVQRPWEFVTGMRVHSLEQSQGDPETDGEKMQATSQHTPNDGNTNGTETKKHHLNWMGVFGSQTKWRSIPVVLLVNIFVENSVMQPTMEPVVPCVLQHEKYRQLETDGGPRGEGNLEADSQLLAHGVEKPTRKSFHQKMRR